MYNQPRPLRPAKPWEAANYLRSSREDLGFDAARWSKPESQDFAEAGLVPPSRGFDVDRYEPMHQPLTPQAIKALALLDDEHRNEDFAEPKEASQDGSSTNAHLPFVPDVYVPIGTQSTRAKSDTPAIAQPPLATSYEAAAPAQETSPTEATSPDGHTEDAPTQSHNAPAPQDQDVDETVTQDELAQETFAQEALVTDSDAPDHAAAGAQAHAAAGSETSETPNDPGALDAHATESESEPGTNQSAADAPQDLANAPADLPAGAQEVAQEDESAKGAGSESIHEPVREPEPEPEPLPVGISEQEMAQREAQHFERGLAQGREEGARQARDAMAQEVAAQCALLSQVTREVQALVADPKQFFEPLKRLSLHLAEQLVLGELSTSSKAIERLVQHCLDEVSHPLQEGVVVELNPEDKKRLQAQGGDFLEGLRLEAAPELQPGSVRVFANDMVVEDLVAHRLQALAHGLMIDVPSWQNKSALASTPAHTHNTEHDDDLA